MQRINPLVEKFVHAFFRRLARLGARRPGDDRIAFRVTEITRLVTEAGAHAGPASLLLRRGAQAYPGLQLPSELLVDVEEALRRVSDRPVGREMAWNIERVATSLDDAERLVGFELDFELEFDEDYSHTMRSICKAIGDVALNISQAERHLEFFIGDPNSYLPVNASKREARWTRIPLGVASWVAAGVRPQARAEWVAEIAAAQDGEVQTTTKRLYFAVDLLRAAVRIRLAHIGAPFVAAFDRMASSDKATFRCVIVVVASLAFYVFQAQGMTGVISDGESLFTAGGGVYGILRWRRRSLKEREEILPAPAEDDESHPTRPI